MAEHARDQLADGLLAASTEAIAVFVRGAGGAWIHDRVNDAYATTFGTGEVALAGDPVRELVADRAGADGGADGVDADGEAGDTDGRRGDREGGLTGALAAGEAWEGEATLRRVDGERFRARVSLSPADDRLIAVVEAVEDGPDRERLLSALHEAAGRIQRATTAEAVFERAVEAANRVLGWEHAACWRHDADAEELVPVAGHEAGTVTLAEGDEEWDLFRSGEPGVVAIDPDVPGVAECLDHGMVFPLGDHGVLGAAAPRTREYADEAFETLGVLAAHVETALDRVERESRFRESEKRYRRLVESAPVPIGIVDRDGVLVYCNPAGAAFLGADDPESVLGTPVREFVYGDDLDAATDRLERAIEGGAVTASREARFVGVDGAERVAETVTAPTTYEGSPAAQVVLDDVTERRERERTLETLISNLPGVVYRCANERGWPMEFVGGESEALTGYPAAAIEADEVLWGEDVILPGDREDVWAAVQDALDRGEPFELTYRIRTADGDVRWVWERGRGVGGTGDEPAALEGFITDITDRVRRRQVLESLHEATRSLMAAGTEEAVYRVVIETARDVLDQDHVDVFRYDPDAAVLRPTASTEQSRETYGHPPAIDPGEGVVGWSFEHDETAVVDDLDTDDRATAEPVEQRSLCAVPLGDHGVLVLSSPEAGAFDDDDVRFGTVLGANARTALDRAERERELRRQERRYRTLAEHFPEGAVVLFDDDYRYQVAAGEAFDDLDLSPGAMEGSTIHEALDASLAETLEPRYRAALAGESRTFELEYGGREWEVHTLPVRDEDGEVFAGMSVSQDVTERKRRERELERYETVVETVSDGIYVLDPDDRFVAVNEALVEMTGYDRGEIVGEHVSKFAPEWVAEAAGAAARRLVNGESTVETVETEIQRADGGTVPVEIRMALLPGEDDTFPGADGEFGIVGVIRDVTDRRERERALEESERRYRTLVERFPNGAVMLFDEGLEYTVAGGEALADLGLDPGDVEGRSVGDIYGSDVEDRFVPACEAALAGESRVFEHELAGREWEVHTLPVRDEDGEVFAGVGMAQEVTERNQRERELRRQRDELETLNRITDLLLRITRALAGAPSRSEVEETVCERLAASELYRFAWVGTQDVEGGRIRPRTSAGDDEGYLREVIDYDESGITAEGPAGEALRTGEVQVIQDVREDPAFEPWREAADSRGIRSAAAVPLVHGDAVYGILAVYADRPGAFSDREQDAFAILGETVGFVINAVENRQLLVADTVVELEFAVADRDSLLVWASESLDCTVELEGYAAGSDDADTWLVYLTVEDADPSGLAETAAGFPAVEDARVVGDDGDGRVELAVAGSSFLHTVLECGGKVRTGAAEDGHARFYVDVPAGADVREVTDRVLSAFPDSELVARRERDRPVHTAEELRASLDERLTERQHTALRAAFYAGYFDWPRGSTAEEVADSMGITSATLHNHLRKAERELLEVFFDEDDDPGRRPR